MNLVEALQTCFWDIKKKAAIFFVTLCLSQLLFLPGCGSGEIVVTVPDGCQNCLATPRGDTTLEQWQNLLDESRCVVTDRSKNIGICVDCRRDKHCDKNKACNNKTYKCTLCKDDTACAGAYCQKGECKECLKDSHCASNDRKKKCEENRCVLCTPGETSECVPSKDKKICKMGSKTCKVNYSWGECKGFAEARQEVCDGKDNDCDGHIDNLANSQNPLKVSCYEGPKGTQSKGSCLAGSKHCINGSWSKCEGSVVPKVEQCNQKDDDCDGQVDEDDICGDCKPGDTRSCYSGSASTKGTGICRAGNQFCTSQNKWSLCAGEVKPSKEVCNSKDDDCDGQTDEDGVCGDCKPADTRPCYLGPANTKDKGICKAGTQKCTSDRKWGLCTGEVKPQVESCNNKDDDCNGSIDESLKQKCKTLCEIGVEVCHAGIWKGCTARKPIAEVCNGKDDDCDGQIDEGLKNCSASIKCSKDSDCPKYQLCRWNTCHKTCTSDADCKDAQWCNKSFSTALCVSCTGIRGGKRSGVEKCNGKDDNCNGKIDETFIEKGQACKDLSQKGVCQSGLVVSCVKGSTLCKGVKPDVEKCNGKDNNCDGQIDDCAREVLIKAGKFVMGTPPRVPGRAADEVLHDVTLSKSFYMRVFEVTLQEFESLMKYKISSNTPILPGHQKFSPADLVTWHEAAAFCNALSKKKGLSPCFSCTGTGKNVSCKVHNRYPGKDYYLCGGYRLPTEAEWEYAYRAGTNTSLYNGELKQITCQKKDVLLDAIGWYCANSSTKMHPVGLKIPNQWGLYDMSGNAFEWVYDWYGAYPKHPVRDPIGPLKGTKRIRRGGAYHNHPTSCRGAIRHYSLLPTARVNGVGFRVVRTKDPSLRLQSYGGGLRWENGSYEIDCKHYWQPATSNKKPATHTGIYWIKPTQASSPFRVWCENGWTRIARYHNMLELFNYDPNRHQLQNSSGGVNTNNPPSLFNGAYGHISAKFFPLLNRSIQLRCRLQDKKRVYGKWFSYTTKGIMTHWKAGDKPKYPTGNTLWMFLGILPTRRANHGPCGSSTNYSEGGGSLFPGIAICKGPGKGASWLNHIISFGFFTSRNQMNIYPGVLIGCNQQGIWYRKEKRDAQGEVWVK